MIRGSSQSAPFPSPLARSRDYLAFVDLHRLALTFVRSMVRLSPRLHHGRAWRGGGRLLDGTPHEAFYEDGDEGSQVGGAELAVGDLDPAFEVKSGDQLAWIPLPKPIDDPRDLLVVRRLGLRRVRAGVAAWGRSW